MDGSPPSLDIMLSFYFHELGLHDVLDILEHFPHLNLNFVHWFSFHFLSDLGALCFFVPRDPTKTIISSPIICGPHPFPLFLEFPVDDFLFLPCIIAPSTAFFQPGESILLLRLGLAFQSLRQTSTLFSFFLCFTVPYFVSRYQWFESPSRYLHLRRILHRESVARNFLYRPIPRIVSHWFSLTFVRIALVAFYCHSRQLLVSNHIFNIIITIMSIIMSRWNRRLNTKQFSTYRAGMKCW